jgi:hypothetical protein
VESDVVKIEYIACVVNSRVLVFVVDWCDWLLVLEGVVSS